MAAKNKKKDIAAKVLSLLQRIKNEEGAASLGSGSSRMIARAEMANEIYDKVKRSLLKENGPTLR